MIQNSPIASVLTDPNQPDNPIIACNEAFSRLTQYSLSEITGRNCRFLAAGRGEPWQTEQIRMAVANGRPVVTQLWNYRKDGSRFRNAIMIVPLFDVDGQLTYFMGTQVEVPTISNKNDLAYTPEQTAKRRIERLKSRHQAILMKMVAGKLNKQIAWDLGLSERTIKMDRADMFRKLGVTSAAEAIRVATDARR